MQNEWVKEKRIQMGSIPAILYTPAKDISTEGYPTIIFYHGWGSSKENQKFRGFILAFCGFQVILPDSIYHGERSPIDHEKPENVVKYFWKVILNSIEESQFILDSAVEQFQADPNRIGVAGHSMGGFTASGVFSAHEKIKALAVVNGSCAWNFTNRQYAEIFKLEESPLEPEEQEKIDQLDPLGRIEQLKDRPIFILHGEADGSVPVDGQRHFVKTMHEKCHSSETKYREYPRVNHYITTNMMEDMVEFFTEKLNNNS